MADQPAYTGATYNADIYKKPNESITDYMARLSKLRSQGILGGGGMFDSGPAPTVTTPDYYSDETDLGILKKNVRSSDSNYSDTPIDTRTPEEKRADSIKTLARQGGWADVGEGIARFFGAGPLLDLGRELTKSQFEQDLIDRAMSEEYIKEIMDNPKATVDMYSKGGFGDVNPLMDGISYDNAGDSIFYQLSTIPDRIGSFFSGETYNPTQNAYLYTKPAADYAQFQNFLAQQTPAFNVSNGSGMLSNVPVTPDMPNYIVDTGSGITTSGSYNDSGDWSWSGTDFSAPSTTKDGNDWNSW